MSAIRVLLVDDHAPWRRLVSSILAKQPELQIIGEASDGQEAVYLVRELKPELILLDIGMPKVNGIEAAGQIRELSPMSTILFVSENRSWDIAREALRSGGSGYVVKSDAGSELLPAIEAVLDEKQFVSRGLKGYNSVPATEPTLPENILSQPQSLSVDSKRHELRLYQDDAAFVNRFAHSIEAVLESGNVFVLIATKSHLEGILQKLTSIGVDIRAAVERRSLIALDVADCASTLTVDIPAARDGFGKNVRRIIGEAVRTAKELHLHVAVG